MAESVTPKEEVIDAFQTTNADSNAIAEKTNYTRTKMLARVAISDAHFKHQQLGEPDLNLEQKIEIAQTVLDSSKVTFLSRFWKYLELEDLDYFQDSKNIYEVNFYMQQVMKNKNQSFQKNKTKNRRYEAMKKLISEGEYFSEEEMKFRDPYLYDQMIGQYLTSTEIQRKIDKTDLTFSSILLKHIDQLDENVRFEQTKDKEEGQEEEEEDSNEEQMELEKPNDSYLHKAGLNQSTADEVDDTDDDKPKIPEHQREALKAEFLSIMQERFLCGEDKNFDYSKVDNNDVYDDLKVLDADAEEKYFDEEDPESFHSENSL